MDVVSLFANLLYLFSATSNLHCLDVLNQLE